MKVLLCLCACIAAATAHGVISYPVAPLPYHKTFVSPLTITHPLGVVPTYTVPVAPYFTYDIIPNSVFYPGVPGVVHYVPLAPGDGKGKPGKKKPGKDDKDKKEETTEESKKDEESESKTEETEDLAH